ncbi:DUF2971 domain-containing protein [Spongorhabdus nitratireducens]
MYKYLDENGVLVLEHGTLKFGTARSFNDPFELRPVIDNIASDSEIKNHFESNFDEIVEDTYQSLSELEKAVFPIDLLKQITEGSSSSLLSGVKALQKPVANLLQGKAHDTLQETVGVLCLTENENDHLMWAHYANSHKGFMIEFDTSNIFFNQRKTESDSLRHLVQVDYDPQRRHYTLSELSEEDLYTFKDEAWRYENEWRMMVALCDADETKIVHGETIHLFKFPFDAIKRVVLGANSDDNLEKRVKDSWKKNFPHASIFKAVVDEKEYSLKYEKIKI